MLKLIFPDISHKEQWKEVMKEWGDNWRKNPRIFFQDTYEKFLEIVDTIKNRDDRENNLPKSSCYFLCDDERILGMYVFRHNLDFGDDAISGGHIGYGIRPSERKKGYGKIGLKLVLDELQKSGFSRVFISCDDDNTGSVKIIEANGGQLEKFTLRHNRKGRRYFIDLFQEQKQMISSLEIELLGYETRHNPARIDELLADDFFECGKYGDRFGKKEVLDSLPKEADEKQFETHDVTVHMLSESIGQVRYLCTIENPGEPPTTSFRTSLWRKRESGWQIFFHQGTLLKPNN